MFIDFILLLLGYITIGLVSSLVIEALVLFSLKREFERIEMMTQDERRYQTVEWHKEQAVNDITGCYKQYSPNERFRDEIVPMTFLWPVGLFFIIIGFIVNGFKHVSVSILNKMNEKILK